MFLQEFEETNETSKETLLYNGNNADVFCDSRIEFSDLTSQHFVLGSKMLPIRW